MPTPTAQQPTSIPGRVVPSVDASMVASPFALGPRREVLEQSSLAIVEVDMQVKIRYANPAAMRLLGAPANYVGLSLDLDEKSKKLVDQEIARRRAGFIGNYRVILRRFSDAREIPVEISGFPVAD